MSDPKIIVALDYDNADSALLLAKKLNPELCRLKIGKELFTSSGPDIVKQVQDLGFEVFLDLKFHDIPVTVAKACKAAANLGVWMLNVHAMGGAIMMKAAMEAVQDSRGNPLLIAVTLLTSHTQQDIEQIGFDCDLETQVLRLAKLASESGLAGVVCSAKEAFILKKEISDDFICVTPGIRPAGVTVDDQKRVVTPRDALLSGASYLVIGRPITQSPHPEQTLIEISQSLQSEKAV